MRNKNIFIRKETAFSCLNGNNMPVFAHVIGYDDNVGNVVYEVNYPVAIRRGKVIWRFDGENDRIINEDGKHVPEYLQPHGPTIYVKPLEDFLQLFTPDYYDEFARFDR